MKALIDAGPVYTVGVQKIDAYQLVVKARSTAIARSDAPSKPKELPKAIESYLCPSRRVTLASLRLTTSHIQAEAART